MVKIAIDYTPAYEQGAGIGRLVREQVKHVTATHHEVLWRLFVAGYSRQKSLVNQSNSVEYCHTLLTPKWLARIWHRVRFPLPVEAFVGAVDLYHATDFVLPPTLPQTKTILTVHDLSFVRVPNAASPTLKKYLDVVVPRSIQRANHIIADSASTKQDIIDTYGTSPHKITTVLSGIEERFHPVADVSMVKQKYGLMNIQYMLCVGTVQPRKNYSRVIQALHKLHQIGNPIHLAIAGGKGWLEDEMYQTLDTLQMRPYVHFLGFVDDNDLPALYSGAFCTIYASLYEGFGFPILESMACGTPVITADISSMPEVSGQAALLVNPHQPEEILYAIQQLLKSETRAHFIEKGYERVRQFTWEKSAANLWNVYERVLQS